MNHCSFGQNASIYHVQRELIANQLAEACSAFGEPARRTRAIATLQRCWAPDCRINRRKQLPIPIDCYSICLTNLNARLLIAHRLASFALSAGHGFMPERGTG
jgi:hypothetical protein